MWVLCMVFGCQHAEDGQVEDSYSILDLSHTELSSQVVFFSPKINMRLEALRGERHFQQLCRGHWV